MTIEVVGLGFNPVRNLPPRKSVNAGSAIPLEWEFTLGDGGPAFNSSDALPTVTITDSKGDLVGVFAEDPGSSDFKPPTDTNFSWNFNWQTQNASGEDLPPDDYGVRITSLQTGQTFPPVEDDPIPITLTAKKGKK